ncbi:hypothetical protein OHT17_01095 [Streptomyces sp. NBC_00371]
MCTANAPATRRSACYASGSRAIQPGESSRIAPTWFAAFGRAGCALAEANDNRQLHRGLREVLACHVIWHWNRTGLSSHTQAILTQQSRDVILGN